MDAKEFKAAFAIANDTEIDVSGEDIDHLFGYGLPGFGPVVATVRQIARLMRWQAMYIFSKRGESPWDMEALNDLRDALRRKVTIIG